METVCKMTLFGLKYLTEVPKVNKFLNATTMVTPFLARFSAKKI